MTKEKTTSIVTRFYQAFQLQDADSMVANYHRELEFQDPVFGKLNYEQTCAMWQMLCTSAPDLKIEFTILRASDTEVVTSWLAEYTFSKTGRHVRNKIMSRMNIRKGKIIRHIDEFNLYKWAKQALGVQGWLIGGTPYFRKKLQQQTRRQLNRYRSSLSSGE